MCSRNFLIGNRTLSFHCADAHLSTPLVEEFADTGKYICVFDPLDGSSILDTSPKKTGTAIYLRPMDGRFVMICT